MPLHVHTARLGLRDPDLLDVTAKSGDRTFAPTWALLKPYLDARDRGELTDERWAEYVASYTLEMRASYRVRRFTWDALLARPRVVLACYCTDPDRCHRRVLAEILAKLGAIDEGEIGARQGALDL